MPAKRTRPLCARTACRSKGAEPLLHSRFRTAFRRQQRYRCAVCGRTFTASSGTPYHRLRSRPALFDRVIALSVEGMSKAGISRVCGISPSTVARWIKLGARHSSAFNDLLVQKIEPVELQADELRTYTGAKDRRTWIFTSVEVWSRLWTSLLVGSRTMRNTRLHMRDLSFRCNLVGNRPLITTDGFKYNEPAIRKVFGPQCVYAQVEKTHMSGKCLHTRVRRVLGTDWQFERAMERSEDSKKINTSYVERLNLTIRRSIAALQRKTTAYSRCRHRLRDQLEILRCYYNFIRPHSSLKFGGVCRTPAQQAGLVRKRLSFKEVFQIAMPTG